MSQQNLRAYARTVRNLVLMFGFLGGAAGLVAMALGLLIWPITPDFVGGYVGRYPAAAFGVLLGFATGVIGAEVYRRKIPGNLRGAGTLLLIITGFGGMVGLGQALLGTVGAVLGLIVIILGAAAFIYMEKTNPPAAE
ncbi:MAG TPA: hypothetical protein VD973_07920 [Symbiobacteriaceae bacterium]|nr:hypothetical protein [Symbiobacteriaceae bacterium]